MSQNSENELYEINKFKNQVELLCSSEYNKTEYFNDSIEYILYIYGSLNYDFYKEQFKLVPFHLRGFIYLITYSENDFIIFINNHKIVYASEIPNFRNGKECPYEIIGNLILRGKIGTIIKKNIL